MFPGQPDLIGDKCVCITDKNMNPLGCSGPSLIPWFSFVVNPIFYRLVGCYLDLNAEFCFVMEEESEIRGYALSSLDAKQFYNKISASYMEELSAKYPLQQKDSQEMPTPAQVNFYLLV